MALPKKNEVNAKVVSQGKVRVARYPGMKHNLGTILPNSKVGEQTPSRVSPSGVQFRSPSGSPRTSPGLLAKHYAGCKFSEPPLPSALPLPPQHWMQATRTVMLPFCGAQPSGQHQDIAQQLKVLLKVQV